MTGIFLGGLAVLIMGSIGALASSADAFSSVLSRGLNFSPSPIVRKLVQDTGETPRTGDDQAGQSQSPSGGSEASQPPAAPPVPSGDQIPTAPPPAPDQTGEARGSEGQSVENPPSDDTRTPPFTPGPDGAPGSVGGEQPSESPRANLESPRGPENGRMDRPEGTPPESNGRAQGQDGSSDEDRQAQDEARQKKEEARQKAMEAKQLARMKRDIKRRVSELNRFKSTFKRFAAKGLTVPADCSDAITQAESVIAAAQGAESMEAMEDADTQSLNDHFETLNECKQRLEQLSRLPQMLKRFDSQIRATERQWNRLKKGAPESAQDAVALGDRILAGIKTARIRLDEQIKTGEIEDFEAVLEDEIIGKFDDLNAAMQQIDAAKNAKRFIAQFAGRLKEGQRMIAKLKKLGKDTSALEDLLARTKALYERIKSLKSGNDEYTEAVEELADLGQEFAEATGGNEDVGGMVKPIVGGPSPRNGGSETGGGPGPGSMAP